MDRRFPTGFRGVGNGHTVFPQQRRVPHKQCLPGDGSLHPTPPHFLEGVRLRGARVPPGRVFHDGFRQRVCGASVGGGGQAQQFGFRKRRVARLDPHHLGLVGRQRAGFVEHHRVHLGERFEMNGTLDQDAAPGSAGDGGDHDQRSGQPQFGGRGEDHQGDDGPHVAGDEVDHDQEDEHNGDQPRRHLVGQLLHRSLLGLRPFDHRDDPREGGIAAELLGHDVQSASCHHRPGEHRRAGGFFFRQALACDGRFVDRSRAPDNLPVDGDLLTCANQHDIADPQFGKWHAPLAAGITDEGDLWHRTDQRLNGCAGPVSIQFGDELGDEDDHHQHRAGDRFATEHRDQGRHGDENLRPNLALADEVVKASLDERVKSDGDRHPEGLQRHQLLSVEQRDESGEHDAADLDPSFPCQESSKGSCGGDVFGRIGHR